MLTVKQTLRMMAIQRGITELGSAAITFEKEKDMTEFSSLILGFSELIEKFLVQAGE